LRSGPSIISSPLKRKIRSALKRYLPLLGLDGAKAKLGIDPSKVISSRTVAPVLQTINVFSSLLGKRQYIKEPPKPRIRLISSFTFSFLSMEISLLASFMLFYQ